MISCGRSIVPAPYCHEPAAAFRPRLPSHPQASTHHYLFGWRAGYLHRPPGRSLELQTRVKYYLIKFANRGSSKVECMCIPSSDSYFDPVSTCKAQSTQTHSPKRYFKRGPGRWKKRQGVVKWVMALYIGRELNLQIRNLV